jgi:hypothetical protein
MEDNQGTIDLAKNAVHHKRSKHIDVRHHFIRDCLEHGYIELVKVGTRDNIADGFTKALPPLAFKKFAAAVVCPVQL